MIQLLITFLCCNSFFNWSSIMPILAFILSIIALFSSRVISKKTIRLSIQQAIFKTISEKAKECNSLWECEPDNERKKENPTHYKIMSELIISIEILEKSFELFGENDKFLGKYKDYYYYLFWKQLRTDLRGWIRTTPTIAKIDKNSYYSEQVETLISKFKKHFELIK